MILPVEDHDLGIDPREFTIDRFGHKSYYLLHYCPICKTSSECKVQLCKLEHTVECLPCLTKDLLIDIEQISKEGREFLAAAKPTDPQGLMWWMGLRAELDGKLKGLATRAGEVLKRQYQEAV